MRTGFLVALCLSLIASAADKNPREGTGGAENDRVEIQARVMLDKDEISKALGAEVPAGIAAIELTIIPHGDEPLSFGRDDFTLVSHKDGQRSGPYAPSQIAGNDVLVIAQKRMEGGGAYPQNTGPVWGGAPGTIGRPRQMPGGGGVGTAAGQTSAEATVKTGEKDKPNPLLAALQAKTLPDSRDIKEPLKGYLYFPLEGKQKAKDLELLYRGPGGRLQIPFR